MDAQLINELRDINTNLKAIAKEMTYSNGLKSVVSDYGTTDEVAPRKPSKLSGWSQ